MENVPEAVEVEFDLELVNVLVIVFASKKLKLYLAIFKDVQYGLNGVPMENVHEAVEVEFNLELVNVLVIVFARKKFKLYLAILKDVQRVLTHDLTVWYTQPHLIVKNDTITWECIAAKHVQNDIGEED